MSELNVVGKEIPKFDAAEKVTGRSVYIHDLTLPGMLCGKIMYSEKVSAKILSIDTSEALKVPGVKAVITAYDTPVVRFGFMKDNTILKKDRVRQYRDEIAAVAATSWEACEEAIAKIKVEYEELAGIFSVEEAMAEGAPLLHELDARGKPLKDNRLRLPWKIEGGDVAAGEAASAFICEGEYEVGWVSHCCLGTSGCVASFDTSGALTMYSSTQIPSLAKTDFLEGLKQMGIRARVRVVNVAIGGGFGSKLDTYAFEYIAILLAHRTKKPVKILFDREEEFVATSPRQPAKIKIRQGCDAEGHLTFRDIEATLDNGAYTSWGATTPTVMMLPSTSLYRVDNVRFRASCVYTNNTYAQAFRGYGTPQVTFAIETNLDELAVKAGLSSYEIRLRNASKEGDITPQGLHLKGCGHTQCLEEVGSRFGLDKREKSAQTGTKKRGVGLACLMHTGGGAKIYKSDGCGSMIKMDDEGRIDLFSGSMDIGQGLDTILRQIVSETIGLPYSDINVVIGDTDVCPWDVGVHASRSTFVAGNSALGAARQIREQILTFAEAELECPREILDIQNGVLINKEDASKNMPLPKLLRKAHFASAGNTMFMATNFFEPDSTLLSGEFKGDFSCAYVWGCHGVEVEVDTETGKIEVTRYVAAHDVGKAINPLLLKGQIYGGGLMGIGYALCEEMVYEKGRLLNPNFRDYKILTARDVVPVEPVIVETENESCPFGAKGIGEPGLVPTAPAIANAIYDAIGIRLKKLPMKPEDVLEALGRRP